MSKAIQIMDYCNMSTKTPSQSMEYFMRKKKAQRLSRPIIKKEFYTKRYLKGVSYINPNISKLLERNRKNAEKIRNYIIHNFAPTM